MTEHKRAAHALHESELRYRNLFNSIDEGFCIIEVLFDAQENPIDYCFLEVNPAFEQQTSLVDVVGKRIREVIPNIEAHWIEILGNVALTGQAIRFTNEAKALDGRWFDVSALRIGGLESRKVALLFNDITARRQAEQELERLNATLEQRVVERTEALLESEKRLRFAMRSANIGLWDWDLATSAVMFSPEWKSQIGYAADEIPDRFEEWQSHVHPDDYEFSLQKITDFLANPQRRYEVEFRLRHKDGSYRWIYSEGNVMRDAAGQPMHMLGCHIDITERKLAEMHLHELNNTLEQRVLERTQALADLDRRKDEFLAMLGHELRNLLAALANAAQLLQLQKHEDPLQKQGLAIIERQVGQLKRLVDELLEVSRIATGSIRLRLEQISLGDVVERALETVRPLIAQHRHALERALAPEPIVLQCDPARLEQVLVNLLSNAAKYTDDGGQIWLGLEREGNAAVLRVRDTGIGIAPDLLPHIFDLFAQAERSLDRSQGGLGIGLSLVQRLVQRLVELHGGTVAAHSVVGQGSEFVVRLPLMQAPLAPLPAPTPDAALSPEPQASGCQVLIVDDNVDAAETLGILLGITGHAVTLAHDGPSAVQAAIDGRPDVVLLDIGLPGFDGYEVAERIRQHAALQGVVLVALTGYGQDKDRQRSREAGFDHHLVKPVSFSDVKRILAEVAEMAG